MNHFYHKNTCTGAAGVSVIIKIVFGVPDKMSGKHSVLCRTFWFPAGHHATWKCQATFVSSSGHFLHIVNCWPKCLTVLELPAGHFKIALDMSGMSSIFGNHWHAIIYKREFTSAMRCSSVFTGTPSKKGANTSSENSSRWPWMYEWNYSLYPQAVAINQSCFKCDCFPGK